MVSFVSVLRSVFSITTIAAALSSSVEAIEQSPVLKFVYFVPSNIAFDPNAYAAMQTVAADYAKWNQQYFGGKAPNYKSDYVLGDHTWEWYVYNRDEVRRTMDPNTASHGTYFALGLTHPEIIRKLNENPKTDKNLKHVIFMHEHAASEDTSECANEPDGVAWMSYENILLARTERTFPPLVLAHEMGHVFGLDHVGLDGDCMIGGFDNANKTCSYSPSNKAIVLANYGKFYTGTDGRSLGARPAPPACAAKIGDDCTGTNGVRSCCPAEGYCQPMSSTKYQCMKRPATCSDQLTDTDYYGNDIGNVYAATPGDCCTQCSKRAGCRAYTYFYAAAPGINAGTCYLKSLAGTTSKTVGAVSGVILADWSTAPCTAKIGDSCNKNSVNIRTCCPSGSYCMPWSLGDYKCAAIPSQCSVQRMDLKYIGNDLQRVITPTPDACCDACSQTEGCKAYTYYASAVGGNKAGSCYLKSDYNISRWEFGAVSGSSIISKPCQNKVGDSCFVNPCCPSNAYCQPMGTNSSQCVERPAQCGVQLPNLDIIGNDVKKVTATSSSQCCEACSLNSQCSAYSYYHYTTPGRKAGDCYLKSAAGGTTTIFGAVSGSVTKRVGCQAKIDEACGFDLCCPSDGYCQPLAGGLNRCMKKPAQCGVQLPNIDFFGNDVAMVNATSAEKCCDACALNSRCNAYSYYQYATPGRGAGACYLKSAAGTNVTIPGAVSGSLLPLPGCRAKIGEACGSNDCCPSDGYCQPLAGGLNQCMKKPATCGVPFTNLEYTGNDIRTVTKVQSADKCCDACSQTPNCKAYSFYLNATPGHKAGDCNLKSAAGSTTTVIGAVSGSDVTPSGCQAKIDEACGFDSCCPSDGYCQPLAGGLNRCMKKPAQCGVQLPNIDFFGNDVAMVTVPSAEKCCDACALNSQCNAYSYYQYATPGRGAGDCYLKSAAGTNVTITGAVSALLPPRPGCQAKIGEACGSNDCCPSDGYCQPLAGGLHQCVKKPARCQVQLPNVDHPGKDLVMVEALSSDECCVACTRKSKCKAYSFYQFETEGRSAGACYLKTAAVANDTVVGAVSGSVTKLR